MDIYIYKYDALDWDKRRAVFTGPGAPVKATIMRERTPLGSFGIIMKPYTTFLAEFGSCGSHGSHYWNFCL